MQNLRRGHYELGVDARNTHLRVAPGFDELAEQSDRAPESAGILTHPELGQRNSAGCTPHAIGSLAAWRVFTGNLVACRCSVTANEISPVVDDHQCTRSYGLLVNLNWPLRPAPCPFCTPTVSAPSV